jgi:hypothetical protein
MQLSGYSYTFKQNEEEVKKGTPVEHGMGVMAQELARIFPVLAQKSKQGHYLVNYDGLVPVLIEAVKEQQGQIEALKAENESIQERLERLEKLVEELSK